ncbi:PEST proteolytic signal-containing nuclear protein isoform X2 [Nematostella vectensis]|uniref:PEST proteolytic signal-containing nuclear protein isoform X2 n=1 Tax=Nematostella vectensis TaxID=45351 RepID=UPI0020774FCB|nr:PEST proteolytic signal-containing nuclear protein isoform X2 [Nematostella vectensis]
MADSAREKDVCERTKKSTKEKQSEGFLHTSDTNKRKDVELSEPRNDVIFDSSEKRKPICPTGPVKIGFKTKAASGISIKLGAPEAKKKKPEAVLPKKGAVAAIFGDDESDEEEMPTEAKMRMKNIGRDTPTSAGPNSFNKGKKGFTHHHKVFEKELKETKPPS